MAEERDIIQQHPTADKPGPEGVGPGSGEYTFRCADVHGSCDWQTRGRDAESMRPAIETHGREQHGMRDFGDDTWNKVRGLIRKAA